MVDDLLSPADDRGPRPVRPGRGRKLIADNDAARADNALRIWALLTLELWQREFLDRPAAASGMALEGAA